MSPHLARVAKEVYGYKNVKYMVAGHSSWQAGINAYYTEPEFLKMALDEGISNILIDLRSPEKARREHIRGAVNFPMGDNPQAAMQKLSKALPGKQKGSARIIYYSDNMDEVVQAHRIMRANGWKNGYILNGGINAWKAKGYPLESNSLKTEVSYKWTPLPGAIFKEEFEKLAVNTPSDTIILDVRSPSEYMKSMVPGAMTIPIDTLDKRWNEVPKNKKIIVMCQAGNRALMGYRILKNNGLTNIQWVDGHINSFSKGILQKGAYGKQRLRSNLSASIK